MFQKWHEYEEFWSEHSKIEKICTLIGPFWNKKYRGVIFITLASDAKFEEKLTCALENNMKNLANFHQGTWKSQNWDFDGILWSKVENIWA